MGKSYSYSAKRDSARFSSKLGLLVLAVALLAALGWALTGTRLDSLLAMIDRESPTVQIGDQVRGAGAQEVSFTVRLADNRAGVEKLAAWIDQDGAKHSILTRDFNPPTKDSEVSLTLPRLQGTLKEGPARLILEVKDASFSENVGRVQQDLLIDFQRPKVEVLSLQHVASQGGAEFVVYRAQDSNLSESGVRVGEAFFRGYKAESMDPSFAQHPEIHVALFALPFGFDAEKQKLAVAASDSAGNSTSVPLHFRIATTVQPNVASKLTEKLLTNKVPALVESYQHMAGRTDRIPLDTIEQQVAAFKIVNEDFRALLEKKLQDLAQSSDRPQLWKGGFLKPMPSATSSTFGESRNYTLKDLNGGHSMHNGLDLASVANDKVVAANDGVVVLAGEFGIYGNAIVIDHGIGLFSLYGHLSSVSKNVGDSVEKGTEIGRTGQTGLAGGDHLHFEFRIRGTPVTPIEWWDAKWLQDNIDGKMAEVRAQLGFGPSAASK